MTQGLKFWRTVVEPTMDAVFGPIGGFLDKRRRKKSYERPVICGHGRDALRYYENGRFVVVEAELTCGDGYSGRLIYRCYPLSWNDSHEVLSEAEAERVFRNLCAELDRRKVRWTFVGNS
jgi:hypothetical protein